MAESVLVFVSHSSDDKKKFIEPIVSDLEGCYINVWLDKRKIAPGENLRKSIFRDGLDKADVALIFFTENSLKSSWVDREIKHVLREESKKGNQFDLNKIISIFDSEKTYAAIQDRYPELTDDLLHLMPQDYTSLQLGQLVSAIWSKYLTLQGGDVETQRQILEKDREIFQKEKEIETLKASVKSLKATSKGSADNAKFDEYHKSGKLDQFIDSRQYLLTEISLDSEHIGDAANAKAFGLLEAQGYGFSLTKKGHQFFEWLIMQE